jgi:hypothetical protein
VKRKSAHLYGIRYRICRVRYSTPRESTHNSKFCAETVIFPAEVHIAQDFTRTLRPSSLYKIWLSSLASRGPIYFSSCVSFNITTNITTRLPKNGAKSSFRVLDPYSLLAALRFSKNSLRRDAHSSLRIPPCTSGL